MYAAAMNEWHAIKSNNQPTNQSHMMGFTIISDIGYVSIFTLAHWLALLCFALLCFATSPSPSPPALLAV